LTNYPSTSYIWDFRGSGFTISGVVGWETPANGDKCSAFDYLSVETSNQNVFVCIWCPVCANILVNSTLNSLTATNFKTPNAVDIVVNTFSNFIDDLGFLYATSTCAQTTGLFPANIITSSSTTGSAYTLLGQKVMISFTAPTTLTLVTKVKIDGFASSTTNDSNFPYGSADT
jgi:hypothetical protein